MANYKAEITVDIGEQDIINALLALREQAAVSGDASRLSDVNRKIAGALPEYIDDWKSAAEMEVELWSEYTYSEFADYQYTAIEKIFQDAVTDFYNGYTPTVYNRRGDTGSKSGGLYDLFNPERNNYGVLVLNEPLYNELFDPSMMHGGRNGADVGLYSLVFVEGWHGGAKSIDEGKTKKYGKHPSPGTPYYRKPHPYYKHWGRQAKKESVSPYEKIVNELERDVPGRFYQGFKRIAKEQESKTQKRMARIESELTARHFGRLL